MKCKYCGAEISDSAKFCTKCGKKQEAEVVEKQTPLFCKKCGAKLKAGARFCTGCGAQVGGTNAEFNNSVDSTQSDNQIKKPVVPEMKETKPEKKADTSVMNQEVMGNKNPVQENKKTPPVKEPISQGNMQDSAVELNPEEKKGKTGKITAIIIVIILILAALVTGTIVICNQFLSEPAAVEERDRDDEEDEDKGSSKKDEASEEASSEESTTEASSEVDLSTVDYNLTKSNTLTLEGNVLESVSEGKVIKLGKPVKFYGANEAGENTLVEDVGSVILNGEKMPKGMLDSIDGNTAVKISGKVSINDGKVYILVDTMQDEKGKDMIAQFEKGDDEDYILPNSSDEYLTEEDIEDLSLQEVNYAKNEIYARHGRKFDSKELRDYFGSKNWYKGKIDPADFDEYSLSKIERANVKLLKDREFSMDPKGYQLY